MTKRVEDEFFAQWDVKKQEIDEEIAKKTNEFSLRGLGRSSPLLMGYSDVYSESLRGAQELLLQTASKVVSAEAIAPTDQNKFALERFFRDVIAKLGREFSDDVQKRAGAMGLGNVSSRPPKIESTLQAIFSTVSTEVSLVFQRSDSGSAQIESVDASTPAEGGSDMLKVFISHSSNDAELAAGLVNLIRSALNLSAREIRCTSVEGYKLSGGADTDETIRDELLEAPVFVGLISDASFESAYVLFELGARWGAKKRLVPLLAHGVETSILKGPISGINALRCDKEADLYQFVGEASEHLEINAESPAAYQSLIKAVANGQPKESPPPEPHPDDQIVAFRADFLKFLRRLKAEWRVERVNEEYEIDGGQAILRGASEELLSYRSMIVDDRDGRLSAALDSALDEIKALQTEDRVLDGGRWAREFWARGDELISSLDLVPEMLGEQLEE